MTYTYPQESAFPPVSELQISEAFAAVMRHVYLWMCAGLLVTAGVAWAMVYTPLVLLLISLLQTPILFYGLLIGQVALVAWLSGRISQLSPGAARLWFLAYAVLNGVTLSIIFVVYTASSIALAFVVTASLFGAMSLIGYTTRLDLSKWGGYLVMGLLGLVIGSVANLFLANTLLEWGLTYAGIALFLGLTVYDVQAIKRQVVAALQANDEAALRRIGLLGALRLYLDFVNLLLRLLRLFGRRRR